MFFHIACVVSLTSLSAAARLQQPLKQDVNNLQDPTTTQPPPEEYLFSLHRQLVDIDSTPDNEHDIGVFLEKYLQKLNFTVEKQAVPLHNPDLDHPQRFNIFAYPGDRDAPFLLTSHIDTVPIFYPYDLTPSTGKISGRGSVDAKACVAAQVQTLVRLRAKNPELAPRTSLLFVVGEEVSGDGMLAANELAVPWTHVIFGEPTEHKLVSGHKGMITFDVLVDGKASHSGYPWLGHSANEGLLKALNALEAMQLPWSEKYGNSTMNIGRINGGTAANVMSEHAMASIMIRIAAGTALDLRKLIDRTLKNVEGEKISVRYHDTGYGPVDIDADIKGFETMTVNYGTDIPHFFGNAKRYLYGPGSIFVAHSMFEHLYEKDLLRAVDDYERLLEGIAAQ